MDKLIKTLIIEDHEIMRFGLTRLLDTAPDIQVCAAVGTGKEGLEHIREGGVDVVILDLTLPDCHGIILTRNIRLRHKDIAVIVFTMHEESRYGIRAIAACAAGYLMKNETPENVLEAVRKVYRGSSCVSDQLQRRLISLATAPCLQSHSVDKALSNRELEILQFIGSGMSTSEIANTLSRSVKTIEAHRENIKKKLALKNGSELMRFAICWRENDFTNSCEA